MKVFQIVRGEKSLAQISAAAIRVEPTGELNILEADNAESPVLATINLWPGMELKSGDIEVT